MELDTRTFRVLDTLARELGNPLSIRELAKQVESHHGTGHYANVYEKLQKLADEGLVTFQTSGRSKIPRLRLDHTALTDTMANLELWRKRQLLDKRPSAAEALHRIEDELGEDPGVLSICLIDAERNLKLRRLELLILLRDRRGNHRSAHSIASELRLMEAVSKLSRDTSLRLDPWVVSADEFGELLTGRDANPAPRALHGETSLWNPQAFWRAISEHLPRADGLAAESPRRLGSVPEDIFARNLIRWGYEERGRELDVTPTPICPEAVAVGALASGIPRWHGAAAVVLSTASFRPTLLAYLAKSEDVQDEMGGILTALQNRRPKPEAEHALDLLQVLGAEPEPIEQDMVTNALELYGG